MAKWRDLLKEDLKKSFGVWERHEAMSVLITLLVTAILSLLATIGIKVALDWNIYSLIGFGVVGWFVLLVFIITPLRMLKDKADNLTRLTTKRLKVTLAPNLEPGDKSQWLRLRVDNPSLTPIEKCYGKLDSYTMLIQHDGQTRPVTDFDSGSSLNNGLPPERHPFPWASTNLPDTLATIAGMGHEFLYVAVLREQSTHFYTPTEMGQQYPKTNIFAEYEAKIDIGSESEAFPPTKVCLRFAMTNRNIEAKELRVITESVPRKAGSQN